MYTSLNPSALGIQTDFTEGLELAAQHGFTGYHFDIREATKLGAEQVTALAKDAGVTLAAWGFPVEFRQDDATYQAGLAELPELAKAAAELGVLRTSTWIMPYSDTLTYRQNFAFHLKRLRPVAEILAAHGVHLGLEYVGPKTMWSSGRFPFIHTLKEMLELTDAVGPNTGLLLDCFHWFTAHETAADLRALTLEQIVEVHVNDAPDLPPDEQQDQVRDLPGATGAIDIILFLQTLKDAGYGGPVMVEPFSQRLASLPADEACAQTAESLQKVWAQAGV